MKPVAVSGVLRLDARPQRSCMQRQFYAIYKQIKVAAVLYVVEPSMVDYLPDDLFYTASNPIEDVVVPAFKREAALGAKALDTSGQLAMENAA